MITNLELTLSTFIVVVVLIAFIQYSRMLKKNEYIINLLADLGQRLINEEPKLSYTCNHEYEPGRGTELSSGIDVYSPETYHITPGHDINIPLGLRFDIPDGWDLSVYNKSGVSTKLKLVKGAELIDGDYTGEVHAHLFNLGGDTITIQAGQKIAQLVMRKVWLGQLQRVSVITKETERGAGGFGSTGIIHKYNTQQKLS